MNKAFTILSVLDIFSELIHLVYQVGILTRQYLVPVVVYVYVVLEQGYNQLNQQLDEYMTLEFTLQLQPVSRPHPMTL